MGCRLQPIFHIHRLQPGAAYRDAPQEHSQWRCAYLPPVNIVQLLTGHTFRSTCSGLSRLVCTSRVPRSGTCHARRSRSPAAAPQVRARFPSQDMSQHLTRECLRTVVLAREHRFTISAIQRSNRQHLQPGADCLHRPRARGFQRMSIVKGVELY